MGLLRFFILIMALLAGYWLWKRYFSAPKRTDNLCENGPMVRCQHCQLYLPQHQAIQRHNQWYCSNEHADQKHDSDSHR